MARMHSRKHGKHGSKKPIGRGKPEWLTYDLDEAERLIKKLDKEGKTSSQIGFILRDQYGIPDIRCFDKKMTQITEKKEVPEDIYNLMSQVVNLHRHLNENKHDSTSKRALELLESKIRRLGKYYSRTGKLEEKWKYKIENAKLLVK